jgi:hypothetical protein
VVAVAALSQGVSAGPSGRQAVHVGLVLGGPAPEVTRHAPAMLAEANAIWKPRGVTIALADERDIRPDDLRLTLTSGSIARGDPARGVRAREEHAGLGAIWFYADGVPSDALTLDPAAIRARLAEVEQNGRPLAGGPPAVLARALGRALGRVLAHELGHYLLASTSHSASGLMRASFNGAELAAWDRARFALDASGQSRLRARLAQLETDRLRLAMCNVQFPMCNSTSLSRF